MLSQIQEFINDSSSSEETFNFLAMECFKLQCSKIPLYDKWIKSQITQKIKHWSEIPPLPVDIFKHCEISIYSTDKIKYRFFTSGTSSDSKGVHPYQSLDLYECVIKKLFKIIKNKIIFRVLTPKHDIDMNRSLNFMFTKIVENFGLPESKFYYDNNHLNTQELKQDLEDDIKSNVPIFILGTTFSFLQFKERYPDKKFKLPIGSMVLDTGGTKGFVKDISKEDFSQLVVDYFNVSYENQYSEYGMTELTSHFYASKPNFHYQIPHWVRVQTYNMGGEEVLSFFDLANYDFICKILTSDIGIIHENNQSFELKSRASKANLRGCSLDYEKMN